MADLDGDGDLDLFLGGRVLPGKYPRPASSLVFRNVGGKFEGDTKNSKRLAEVGLVSGAVFSDLDGDGDPDLVLACEWDSLRVFRNEGGSLMEATKELGFLEFKGWWNGVAAGDFDGDGRLDIVASNWGRNTKYESLRAKPLLLFHGDLAGEGAEAMVEAYYNADMKMVAPVRGLNAMAKAMPFLREKFATHRAFAEASVEQILGERLKAAKVKEANWLESTVFLNRGKSL